MLTKQQLKDLAALSERKERRAQQRFLIEGEKSVREVLASSFEVELVLATKRFLSNTAEVDLRNSLEVYEVNQEVLERIGSLESNHSVIAVAKLPHWELPTKQSNGTHLYLDQIADPGNLGTIIRLADWYGINDIYCSPNTTDFFNPKTLIASMGSFCRVKCHYAEFPLLLTKFNFPVYGAVMNGNNFRKQTWPKAHWLMIGSESHGISDANLGLVTHPITIPGRGGAESLNAAMACAIILERCINDH